MSRGDPDLSPQAGNAGVVHAVQRVPQVLAHDDGAVDGQFQVVQGGTNKHDDLLHAVNLLAQEDVHGLQDSHLLQALRHLKGHIVWRQLVQHVIGQPVDNGFTRLASAAAGVFGLDVEDGVQHRLGRFALVTGRKATRVNTSA